MKRILIISYFYPPSTFVGGDRISFWVENLHKHNIYPIVITRQWNDNQKDIHDPVINNVRTIEKTNKFQIHRLPVNNSTKYSSRKNLFQKFFQKSHTFKELLFSNFFIKSLPYYNFYTEARDIIKTNNIDSVIISGRPFHSFHIGHKLKKEFNIKWVPDYRDAWTAYKRDESKTILGSILYHLEKRSEIKWTSNADYFISVSDYWVDKIKRFIKKDGQVVMNGFYAFEKIENNTKPNILKFIYAGTLYVSQPIELFLNSIAKFIENNKFPTVEIQVIFIGTEIEINGHNKLLNLTQNLDYVHFIPRLNKIELKKKLSTADLLLMTNFGEIKGWQPVKLFEYYSKGKPILLVPSDNDVIHEFILKSGCGYTCEDIKSCIQIIESILESKANGVNITLPYNHEYANFYSRTNQTKILSLILNQS